MPRMETNPADVAADESMTHAQLVEGVTPGIEAIRTEIFGSADAPFATHDEAVTWIEQAPPYRPVGRKLGRALIRHVTQETGGRAGVSFAAPSLRYWKPGSRWACSIGVAVGSKHAALATHADDIAFATGWHAGEVVIWMLSDVQPQPLDRLTLRVRDRTSGPIFPGGKRLERKTVVLEVYDPHVSQSQWRRLLKAVRQAFNGTDVWQLAPEDQRLFDIVQGRSDHPDVIADMGEVPAGTTWTAHWQAITDEYNQAGQVRFPGHPRATYTAWDRLKNRLIKTRTWRIRRPSTKRGAAQ